MRSLPTGTVLAALCLLAACGPTPEQQAAMDAAQRFDDQNRCMSYGFQAGTDAFAHCMMNTATQRDAQQAADRRAAAARQAAADRQDAVLKAQKDAADRDAWDRTTHQGAYSGGSWGASATSSPPFASPVDAVRNSIQSDMDKMDRAGMLTP